MKTPKVIFIGLDGAVDAFVVNEAAKGNLPNFARFLKRGCRLTDFRPVHPAIAPTICAKIGVPLPADSNGRVQHEFFRNK